MFRDTKERKGLKRQLQKQRERLAVRNDGNRITLEINRAVVERSTQAEVVDANDGELLSTDNDPYGAVFEISLPQE